MNTQVVIFNAHKKNNKKKITHEKKKPQLQLY